MRWIVLVLALGLGAAVALLGHSEFGSGAPVPTDNGHPGETQEHAVQAEAPRLEGHGARPGTPQPSSPAVGKDEVARLRLSLRTADAGGLVKILGEVKARGPASAGLIQDLIPLLAHEDRRVMQAAADALAAMGAAVVDPLMSAVVAEYEKRGASGAHSSWAMSWGPYILSEVGEPAVVPVAQALGHKDAYFFAKVAFDRLALLRAPMSDATDVVLERLGQVHGEDALDFVIEAVPDLGRDAARAVPRLVDLLADPRRRVRIETVRALGRIGPDASGALTDLEHLRRGMPEAEATMCRALDEAIAAIRGDR